MEDINKRLCIFEGEEVVDIRRMKCSNATRNNVRQNTKAGYRTVVNILKKEEFGNRRIDTVKVLDAKNWLIKLQNEDKRSYSSIHSIRGVVRPAFRMAVEDDLIPKNPFDWELGSVLINDSVKREALTEKQERLFLDFVKSDKHYCKYYDGMYILFKTGMRVSEFCGPTLDDIDIKNRKIKIRYALSGEPLGKTIPVRFRKVQQDIQRGTSYNNAACMQTYLLQ